jgi:hypothetical protein
MLNLSVHRSICDHFSRCFCFISVNMYYLFFDKVVGVMYYYVLVYTVLWRRLAFFQDRSVTLPLKSSTG